MDVLVSWLLLVIAALVTGCVVLYCHLRQVESATMAREGLFSEELDELRGQMEAMEERLQRMDFIPTTGRTSTPPAPSREQPWQTRVLQLSRAGLKPTEIARELEISISEVELALVFPIRLPED
jgi:DNA-binding NarL/FixJ family response regulator